MKTRTVVLTSMSPLVLMTSALFAGDIRFTDVTAESGIDFVFDVPPNNMMPNSSFWGGVGVGDFDGNGAVDIFFPGGGGDHDTLYLNDGTGSFTDASEEWGLVDAHLSNGVGVGDLDGDGWLDVVVSASGDPKVSGGQPGGYRLYRNLEGAGFENIAEAAGVNNVAPEMPQHPTFATPADIDADGDLDLLFGSWRPENQGNKIYRNNGDSTFTDITDELGLTASFLGSRGWSVDVVDMDEDLNPDILWVGDFGRSKYLRNNGDGSFTNMTPSNGTGQDSWGMGGFVFDYNKDNRLDWFVSSIYYDDGAGEGNLNGNALYLQIADHTYVNMAQPAGISDGGWGWSCVAADFDQDGLDDVFVTNGTRFQEEHRNELEAVYQGMPGGSFINVVVETGLDLACEATSVASFDMDDDGDLDLVVVCNDSNVHLFRNDSTDVGSWLKVALGGNPEKGIPHHGFNTRVEAYIGDTVYVRYMDGRPSYGASGPQALHFGLGDAEVIDRLLVKWINGDTLEMLDVPVNQAIFIEFPSADPNDLDGNGRIDGADLTILLGNWGPCDDPSDCIGDINGDLIINGADLTSILGNWTQ